MDGGGGADGNGDVLTMIDWQRIFLNLRGVGISVAETAELVGMDGGAARRYARGEQRRDPPMTQALRLLNLHEHNCPLLHRASDIGEP